MKIEKHSTHNTTQLFQHGTCHLGWVTVDDSMDDVFGVGGHAEAENLADDLIDYQHQQDIAIDGLDDLANELLSDAGPQPGQGRPGLGASEASGSDDGGGRAVTIQQMIQSTVKKHVFGIPSFLAELGSTVQKGLLARVWSGLSESKPPRQRNKEKPATPADAVLENFATSSTYTSVAAVAERTGFTNRSLSRSVEMTACIMLYGGNWLVGSMFAVMRQLFQNALTPIMCISKMKYDETPLRLRVAEFNEAFYQTDEGGYCNPGLGSSSGGEEYRFAKIFRLHWTLGAFGFFQFSKVQI